MQQWRRCSSGDALDVLPPHVYAAADQARRMIVSEKKDVSFVVSVEQRWNNRAAAIIARGIWVQGCSCLPSIHWARLHVQHHQQTSPGAPTTAHSSTIHTLSRLSKFSTFAFAFLLVLPFHLRIDLYARAHAPHQ